MLYSKNGSIPKPEMSGDKEGWVEVEEPPVAPEGKEVVWWCPPGWVVRDPKPAATETTDFSWSQSQEQWIEYQKPIPEPILELTQEPVEDMVVLDTLESASSAMATPSASEIFELPKTD